MNKFALIVFALASPAVGQLSQSPPPVLSEPVPDPQPAWMATDGGPTTTRRIFHFPSGATSCTTCTTSTSAECFRIASTTVACGASTSYAVTSGDSIGMSIKVPCAGADVTASYTHSSSTTNTWSISSGNCTRCWLSACFPSVAITTRRCVYTNISGNQTVRTTTSVRPSGDPTYIQECEDYSDRCCLAGKIECCDSPDPEQVNPSLSAGGCDTCVRGTSSGNTIVHTVDITSFLDAARPSIASVEDLCLAEMGFVYLDLFDQRPYPIPAGEVHHAAIVVSGEVIETGPLDDVLYLLSDSGDVAIDAGLHRDVNYDGFVNINDAMAVANATVVAPTEGSLARSCDINGDGIYDLADINLVLSP